ncbi:FAD/NAD(P)-binding protein [Xanthobacter agilis]|uniref:FAD/NAD(P)-binding protein n=1 Tax=Xanthobacter agilis TaxID=47492 RepID=UPI003727C801
MLNAWRDVRTVLVVGGGFSGALFALSAAARPGLRVVLIEREPIAGRGLAYGACDSLHVLNVPVSRMELGLEPGFGPWLAERPQALASALDEADGDLSRSFVARRLFGVYVAERLEAVLSRPQSPLTRVRGEAVRVEEKPQPAVVLADGRRFEGDVVVLATGNLPPKPPRCRDAWFYDTPLFVPDPWAQRELESVPKAAPVLFIGSGLTMVDVALKLAANGHRGPLFAVSRHGLLPHTHLPPAAGQDAAGAVAIDLDLAGARPVEVMRRLRAAVRRARAAGAPWQKVMDAARPHLPSIWSQWTLVEKARFLRHGRTFWDVHRHRMAPRIAAGLSDLLERGQLQVIAGRITGFRRGEAERRVGVHVRPRGGGADTVLEVSAVVNCSGPRSDFAEIGIPVFADLRRSGRLVPDALGLGIETRDCAVVDRFGSASPWLFAVGPLTRPAWWEITAVPEVTVQIHRLVEHLAQPVGAGPRGRDGVPREGTLLEDFIHLGEGI